MCITLARENMTLTLLLQNKIAMDFIAGLIGSLLKDVLVDNQLKLPKKRGDILLLGCLGGMLAGGAVGVAVDGGFVSAFLAGFAGVSVLDALTGKKNILNIPNEKAIESYLVAEEINAGGSKQLTPTD